MCGIVGFLEIGGFSETDARVELTSMTSRLRHRGPDSHGAWCDARLGVALGHRRLSIQDLSVAGSQPMQSNNGELAIVFNGEIYNHKELRKEMPAVRWRGGSDTETLLEGIALWGLEITLTKLVGMFAFAVWDSRREKLILVRDRIGEKPLYYGWQENTFIFASELSALAVHAACKRELNRRVIPLMLARGCVPAPYSIYKGVWKLMPGSYAEVDASCRSPVNPEVKRYWSLHKVVQNGKEYPFRGSDDEAVDRLDALLQSIVRSQKIADVPVGAFLSGGVDSSLITALMQKVSGTNVKTFCVGFENQKYNEALYAREVARHLGTDHNELCVTSSDILAAVPIVADIFDEPFGDSSAIPTYLVSKLARAQVAVSLSGDGGDELFGGYSRYFSASRYWATVSRFPNSAKASLSSIAGRLQTISKRYPTLSSALSAGTGLGFYRGLICQWAASQKAVINNDFIEDVEEDEFYEGELSFIERARYYDTLTYLTDDVLVKLDRSSMAVSLEGRVPFLDHRLIEFVWRIPESVLLKKNMQKGLLKRLLARYVPTELTERPKMGFGVPIGDMLRGPLRTWAEDLLSESTLRSQGVFNAQVVRSRWAKHLAGEYDYRDSLWQLLMFQSWLAKVQQKIT